MRQVIKRVKDFVLENNFWGPGTLNEEEITNMWSNNWHRSYPYLSTEGNGNKIFCMEKNRKGQIIWKTCYNNI